MPDWVLTGVAPQLGETLDEETPRLGDEALGMPKRW